ncbi:MAG: ABC transporter ATP-binding protein [Alphaproteobacteria bacterium]|nr:ABC transporter ATP-binding protein [Alphaproteobacteria bacterium]
MNNNDMNDIPALEINNLSFTYSKNTVGVADLSLRLNSGKIMALLGPSGCGKTSVLRLIAGLEIPTKGEIKLHGTIVASGNKSGFIGPEKRDIGMLFQEYALFPHLSVAGNVAFAGQAKGKLSSDDVMRFLEMVDMTEFADRYPHMLSGGQQQRVALARAIASHPKLLLLDEPFSGLDARLRDEVRDRTLHVIQQAGIAALMVTHDAEEAMYMADHIALMRDGKLVQAGTPETLYYQPYDLFTAAFMSEINHFTLPVQDGKVATPFGMFTSPDNEAKAVNIAIRPEALQLKPSTSKTLSESQHMRVMASRLIGGMSMVHLYCPELANQDVHLHAYVTGRFLPKQGAIMDVTLDKAQLFIFSA